jgi:predicted amidohydrolase
VRIAVVQTLDSPPDMMAALRAGLARLQEAKVADVDLVVFPELFLGGYYLDEAMVRRASEARA